METAVEPPKPPKAKQIHQKTKRIFTALLEKLKLNPTELARELSTTGSDFSQQLIATYVSGGSKSNEKVLEAIVLRYPKINAHWLLTGKGQPFPAADKQEASEAADDTEPPPPAGQMSILRPTYEELLAENANLHKRLDEKDDVIADLRTDKGNLWQQLQRAKNNASSNAAASMLHVSHSEPTNKATPIGPRFDNEAVMFIAA